MRRSIAVASVVCAIMLLLPGASVAAPEPRGNAQPAEHASGRQGLLADLDGDGVSDGLELRLGSFSSDRRIRVVVTFDGPGGVREAKDAVGAFEVSRRFRSISGFAATMTKAQVVALARTPGVFRVEEDVEVRASMDSADADFGTQRARLDFDVTGAGVEVCVVDTGVDPNHEQLDGKAPIAFYDAVAGLSSPYDDHGHGTHVAAIAVGDSSGGPNAAKYGGVAPGAALSAAKVLNSAGSGSLSQVIAGIDWCAERPSVRVISMSLGTSAPSDGQDSVSQAVNSAAGAGKVVVVAAGNSGDDPTTIGSPGAAAGAITVGAVAEWSAPAGAANHSDGVYLAPFSSRGPTVDGRLKPDIASPGVSITSARAGVPAGYVAYSGTSMATPFVSGTIALALQAAPGWDPTDVRDALEATAADRGPAGKDADYGAGLVDGHAFVATAAGATVRTSFPAYVHLDATVADHGLWTHAFSVDAAGLDTPIAATVLIEGAPVCVFQFLGSCFDYDWGPDLEVRLVDPNGVALDLSTCPLGDECGNGRQETVHAMPTVAGTYRLQVFPTEDAPHNGRGGSFGVDLSTGPGGGTPPPLPPPPPPLPTTMHVGDLDGTSSPSGKNWVATVVVTVHDGSDVALRGVAVTGTWGGRSSATCTTGSAGTCSVSKKFGSRTASATFTVSGLSLSGYSFEATANHDGDGDSNGTVITVLRP